MFLSPQNGLTSCLPIFITTATGLLFSLISHWVSKKDLMSIDMLRKVTTCSSAFGFSLCMAGILLAGCDAIINILCFALSLFSLGIAISGVLISGVDMAPRFSGSVMGVASTVAGIGSFLVPVITGLLTTHNTLSEWQTVFWLNLLVLGSSGLVYLIFGSAEVQTWNYPDPQYSTEAENEETRHTDRSLTPHIEMKEKL
ncbi:hypothetical protein AVEN_255330-1 [Araneus ventricosus]|uniref:Inorganic phosphate cotransporter n=1 Tax=Araneus ventricosus TaxID=182803 RepID=A0A4Y2H065_ARAVE|nr:hypothetical protein AVEN_255330-1 [Araneus ventricosus]